MTSGSYTSHVQRVKDFFEAPAGYFGRRGFDVRVRVAAVQAFTAGTSVGRVLDIGCGNGDISIPLLESRSCERLTLLDLSATMLDLARSRLPVGSQDRVVLINDDFMAFDFGREAFDLIVCVGVFAHAEDPAALSRKMVGLLRPGGRLIVEVTDSFHPVGRALAIYHRVLEWFRPATYRLNKLRITDIEAMLGRYGLVCSSAYRYFLPPPGSQRLFSHDVLYRSIEAVFGKPARNRRGWLGNVALLEFCKPSSPDASAGNAPLPARGTDRMAASSGAAARGAYGNDVDTSFR